MYEVLKGRRLLVIGGSSGIGLAVAQQAAEAGASVTIASRSRSKLDAALGGLAPGASAIQIDTADYLAIESFFAGEAAWDHVVVSAAQTTSGPLRKSSLADARVTMESKFWGCLPRGPGCQSARRRIAVLHLRFPKCSSVGEHRAARCRECGPRSPDTRARARNGAGPGKRGVARPGRHSHVVRHGRSRTRKDVCRRGGAIAASAYWRCVQHRERGPVFGLQPILDGVDGGCGRWGHHCSMI